MAVKVRFKGLLFGSLILVGELVISGTNIDVSLWLHRVACILLVSILVHVDAGLLNGSEA